jgi:hypothetical protein
VEIPVLLQPLASMRFRASTGQPLPVSAEGQTREEALQNLQKLLEEQASQGMELVYLKLSMPGRTIPTEALWPNDETTQAWLEGIEEYRRQADSAPQA